MPKVTFLPNQVTKEVRKGVSVLTASRQANVYIPTRCGGEAACLMCKVIILDQRGVNPIETKEANKLGELAEQNQRLACQTFVFGDVIVELKEDPLKAAVRKQLERLKTTDDLF